MIKNGKVEIGKTPSEVSGEKCTMIKQGSPLCKGEEGHKDIVTKMCEDLLRAEQLTELHKKGLEEKNVSGR